MEHAIIVETETIMNGKRLIIQNMQGILYRWVHVQFIDKYYFMQLTLLIFILILILILYI